MNESRCKTCCFWGALDIPGFGHCQSPKIVATYLEDERPLSRDSFVFVDGKQRNYVGEDFGCVHHEEKEATDAA